ncbi:3-keto-disaccharide hydrolase [Joostella sp. CR20]|uniref:3-keto-disaccharide hydrolase n=1 Tax=Joostella sp. CR20 TaxID=2804312 RepID=UPI00313B66C5
MKLYQFFSIGILVFLVSCRNTNTQPETAIEETETEVQLAWQQLFNGKDLTGWTPKIRHHEVGENYANTFSVKDSYITVNYDGYNDVFNKQYGHLFYNKPFSAYFLAIEYRFIGNQIADGEGWAYRNSGAMLHGQAPETMLKDQDFPISIEGQFLGGNPDTDEERPTLNLCTPGTNVVYKDSIFTPHCTNSLSKTYRGDQWVRGTFLVLKDSIIKHIIEGETVLEYIKPQLGGDGASVYNPAILEEGKPLTEGYISIQSESHPIQFRKVELIDLDPIYHDKQKLNATIDAILKEEKEKM